MKLISSRWTFVHKRVFPLFWFGMLALFFVSTLVGTTTAKNPVPLPVLFVPLAMAVFGYFLMKKLVFDLFDEVWDAGDWLIVKQKGEEERIPLANIMNISFTNLSNPQRVTLTLRTPCRWGSEIAFTPTATWNPFKTHPIVADLIARVDAARSR